MFKTRLAKYINDGMKSHGLTYRKMEELSGVPQSTLSGYAKGKVDRPIDAHLERIAAAFGDTPDVIRAMRQESLDETAAENMLVAKARDKELVEKMEELLRSSAIQIMQEHDASARLQQSEIIAHADKRVADITDEARKRCLEIADQCRQHEQEYKQHCDAVLDAERRAVAAEKKGLLDLVDRLERNIVYLRSLVRNLSIVAALLGVYAVYAYKVFDVNDPTRGLYQGSGLTNLPLLLAFAALCYALVSTGNNILKKAKIKEKEG